MDANALFVNTIARLRAHEGQYAEISRRTGFSYSTLVKLAQGHADNPTIGRLQDLIEALADFEGVPKPVRIDTPEAAAAALAIEVGAPEGAPEGEPDEAQDPDAGRVGPAEATA